MKKQIYEKANKTPHTARRSIGPELPQADPLMIASPRQSRKREGITNMTRVTSWQLLFE